MQTRKIGDTFSAALVVSAMAASPAPSARAQTFGGFAPPQTFPVGDYPRSMAMGDLNGDGFLDLAVANYRISPNIPNTVSVLFGTGGGHFFPQQTFQVGRRPSSVAIGDLEGNGSLDIVVANYENNDVSVLYGNGAGKFSSQQRSAVGIHPNTIALGDLNGDGFLDIATANTGTHPSTLGTISVLLSNGAGEFSPQQRFEVGLAPYSIKIGGLNSDGAPDIVVMSSIPNGAVFVLFGDGAGGFSPPQIFPVGSFPQSVAIDDLDGDGALDLALLASGRVYVLLGDGAGGYAQPQTFPAGIAPSSLAISDMNDDGALDIVVTNLQPTFLMTPHVPDGDAGNFDVTNGDGVSVLLGDGAGGFALPQEYLAGFKPISVVVGKLNADDFPDLAVVNWENTTISILINQTTPKVIPADLTGDGIVNGGDLGIMLSQWGSPGTAQYNADLNNDGVVDAIDLAFLLANWG